MNVNGYLVPYHHLTRPVPQAEGDGPGTTLKRLIGAVVDAMPMPASAKQAIKDCPGCGRRAKGIDRAARRLGRALGGRLKV